MGAHGFYDMQGGNPETVVITGSFAPAGTSAPTDRKGRGFTVSRTGAGDFLLTFKQKYAHLVAALGAVQLSSAADMAVQFGDYVAASKTLVIRTVVAAVETDIAADANNRVHFAIAFQRTTAPAT